MNGLKYQVPYLIGSHNRWEIMKENCGSGSLSAEAQFTFGIDKSYLIIDQQIA